MAGEGGGSALEERQVFEEFDTLHSDYVHDVAFDFFGRRIATCSSDRRIQVFDQDDAGNWTSTAWEAHDSPVWRVCWSHPQFGQVLASCSTDHTVIVWEERERVSDDDGSLTSQWVSQVRLGDSRAGVNDVAFAPKHWGLQLATASSDGSVRIYRASDPSDLAHWELEEEFSAVRGGVYSLSWCDSRWSPPMLVTGGASANAVVWMFTAHKRWEQVCVLEGHADAIHDVAWAPTLGRSFHLIASASRDSTVRLWRLSTPAADEADEAAEKKGGGGGGGGGESGEGVVVKLEAVLDAHEAQVWRVQWSVTGAVLASAADDGVVRLWSQGLDKTWKCATTLAVQDKVPEGTTFSHAAAAATAAAKYAGE